MYIFFNRSYQSYFDLIYIDYRLINHICYKLQTLHHIKLKTAKKVPAICLLLYNRDKYIKRL